MMAPANGEPLSRPAQRLIRMQQQYDKLERKCAADAENRKVPIWKDKQQELLDEMEIQNLEAQIAVIRARRAPAAMATAGVNVGVPTKELSARGAE